MKIGEVPQQAEGSVLGGHRRACYAQDEQGRYVVVPSEGWEVEAAVNRVAHEELRAQLAAARARVEAGRVSPLAYHMVTRQMDIGLLAAYAGVWSWRARWHLRPAAFARLSEDMLARYARALKLDIDTLRRLPAQDPPI